MKTIYLVKKDPEVQGDQNNWITMNSYEFAMFMKTEEGKRRRQYFGEMEAVDKDDYKIVMECDESAAKAMKADNNHSAYLRRTEEEIGYVTFSMDARKNETDRGEDETNIVDTNVNIEEEAIRNIDCEKLLKALEKLSFEDHQLIFKMFLSENPLSEYQVAKEIGTVRASVNWNKNRILRILKDSMLNS